MNKIINIIPVSDLRQDTANILKRLKKTSEPLVVTQRGCQAQSKTAPIRPTKVHHPFPLNLWTKIQKTRLFLLSQSVAFPFDVNDVAVMNKPI